MSTYLQLVSTFTSVLLLSYLLIFGSSVQAATHTINPSMSVQTAINAAASGDTIILGDGKYYQEFTINKPLTLKAQNYGKAMITGAYSGSVTYTAESSPGVYSTTVNWPVYIMMHGDRSFYHYDSLDRFMNNLYDVNKPGPYEGFYYDSGSQKLYLRLLGNKNPNNEVVNFNRQETVQNPGNGILVRASDTTIEGIHFRLWRENAIWIDGFYTLPRKNIYIRHNYFEGIKFGIQSFSRDEAHTNLYVEYNEFSGKPVYELRQRNTHSVWGELYGSTLHQRAARVSANGFYFRHNYVHDIFDGVTYRGWMDNLNPTDIVNDISYNVFQNTIDNALETEPINNFMNSRVHHNFVLDSYTPMSFTDQQFGFLTIDHNIFYNSPEYGIHTPMRWLKTAVTGNAADQSAPINNVTIAHNTVVLPDETQPVFKESWLEGIGMNSAFRNSIMENNILMVRGMPFHQYLICKLACSDVYDSNCRRCVSDEFTFSNHNIFYGTDINAHNVKPNALHVLPKFRSVSPQIDFHLAADSPAVGVGLNKDAAYHHQSRDATDLGAIEYGDTWQMPRPGPSWATPATVPSRPLIPPSLDPSWLGLSGSLTPWPTPSTAPTAAPTNTPTPTPQVVGGDTDNDGDVDIFDYNAVLSNFGTPSGASRSEGDLDSDGDVDIFDYNLVISNFGRGGVTPTPTSSGTVSVTNIQVASGRTYTLVNNGFTLNQLLYTDRSYKVTAAPDMLLNKTFIQTANEDDGVGNNNSFLTFAVDRTVILYVSIDNRKTTPPSWMSDWTNTGLILSSDAYPENATIYSKQFPAGSIALGANGGGGSMYSVIIIPL